MHQSAGLTAIRCSVVIATRRRPQQLETCLESLAAQDYSREDFEVIVVDDGGSSHIEELTAKFRSRLQLSVHDHPFVGRSAARNHGAALARGALVAFTDDDTRPAPSWLGALIARHMAEPGNALGGRTVSSPASNPYARATSLILDLAYAHRNRRLPDGARFFAASNLALPADRFRFVGGFNPRLQISEDRELCDRWIEHGFGMTYVPEAVIDHDAPASLRAFCEKQFGYGRGAFAYQRSRWQRGLGLSGLDPTFYRGAVREAVGELISRRDAACLVLLIAWQALTAAGFAWEAALGERRGGGS